MDRPGAMRLAGDDALAQNGARDPPAWRPLHVSEPRPTPHRPDPTSTAPDGRARPAATAGGGGKPIVLGLILIVVLAFGAGDRRRPERPLRHADGRGTRPTSARRSRQGRPSARAPRYRLTRQPTSACCGRRSSIIRDNYVDRSVLEPTSNLTYGMLDGLVRSLGDAGHSSFMTPDQVSQASEDLSGSFSGIGAFLGERGGAPIIVSVISGSPADKAGLRSGDAIIEIDGDAAEELSVEDVVSLVRGPAGTTVRLTVIHPGEATPIDVPIVRDVIEVPPVDWAMVPGTKAAMVRIVQFSDGTADELQTALAEAKTAGATSIVLDLRNDPGGLVDEAVDVASTFIPEGVVYIREDADGQQIPVKVTDEPRTDLPDGRARRLRLGQLGRDRHRRAPGSGPRQGHRDADLRHGHRAQRVLALGRVGASGSASSSG